MAEITQDIERSRQWVKSFVGFDTPRLHLRPLRATDDTILFDAMENPRVNEWIAGFEKPFTLTAARRWLAPRLERMERGDGIYAGVFYRGTDVLLGFAYAVVDSERGGIEIAGALNELYWGKGFVEEVSFALISDVFAAGVGSVFATRALENWSSMRVLRTLSFSEISTKSILTPNGPRESRIFQLTPDAWRRAIVLPLGDSASAADVRARRMELMTLLRELKSRRRSDANGSASPSR